MERIPILQMGQFLLVTIQVDMHDQLALARSGLAVTRARTAPAAPGGPAPLSSPAR